MTQRFDFSFDGRVAGRYRAQRAHPPAVAAAIGRAIVATATRDAPPHILEIGIGTGRIATPAAQAGARVTGFDLSADMLAELPQPSAPGLTAFQADMHTLPLPDNTFDAVLVVHVLHLARDWQAVLREAVRVLKPGGALIQGDDWVDPQSVFARLRDELRRRALAYFPNAMPPSAGVSKQALLTEMGGGAPEETVAAEWVTPLSPAERLAQIDNRMDNESWFLPQPIFEQLTGELHAFARETWPDLDKPLPVTRRFLLKTTRFAAA